MNEYDAQNILHICTPPTDDRKKQDLIKYMETAQTPHHSSAPMKRRLITIGLCVALVIAFCGIVALSRQPDAPLSDVAFIETNRFQAGNFGTASTDTQTMKDAIGIQLVKPNTLPKIPCSDIIVFRLFRESDMTRAIGIYATLTPADSQITQVDAAYLYASVESNQEILTEAGFRNLPNSTIWQGLEISYSDAINTEKGNAIKIFFEDGAFLCSLDVYAPATMEITELLTAIFG